jgi:hypothetical protein
VSKKAKKASKSAAAVKRAVKKVGNVRKKVEKRLAEKRGSNDIGGFSGLLSRRRRDTRAPLVDRRRPLWDFVHHLVVGDAA